MKYYQLQLSELLTRSSWEIEFIDDQTDWWSAEQWIIVSRGDNYGLKLWINFLVDPQYEGDKKLSAVWAVSACTAAPDNVQEAQSGVVMDLVKGKFKSKLVEFDESLTQLRHTHDQTSKIDA